MTRGSQVVRLVPLELMHDIVTDCNGSKIFRCVNSVKVLSKQCH